MIEHFPAPDQVRGLEREALAWEHSKGRSSQDGKVYTAFICNEQGLPVSEVTLFGLEQLADFTAGMVNLAYAPRRCRDDETGLRVAFVKDLHLRILMRE